LIDFLGLKELSKKYGLGQFDLKIYRLHNASGKVEHYDITTDAQFKFELPNLICEDSTSELNGELIIIISFTS